MNEIKGNMSGEKHGFTVGKSTCSALKEGLEWMDGREKRLVVGFFLDIMGAFDNIKWTELLKDMEEVGVSEATRTIIRSYLTDRWVKLTVEKSTSRVRLTKECP